MPKYLLIYGHPRRSEFTPPVIYEAKRSQTEHPDNDAAIRWARDDIPHSRGIPEAEAAYPAVPMVLWRLKRARRELVWESRPGMALHAVG
jgi:hypothetical protein